MTKLFEVPYNFDKELLTRLEPYKNNIKFLFLSAFYEDWGHTRENTFLDNKIPKTREEYSEHIKSIFNAGYEIGLLVQELTEIDETKFDYYIDLGITIFIVTNDNNAQILKNKGAKCLIASITKALAPAEVNEVNDIYDLIVLPFEFTRNIQLFKTIKESKKDKLILLVNSNCAYDCAVRKQHWHENKGYSFQCPYMNNQEKMSYVPGNDLHFFDPFISHYKLQGREWDTDYIVKNVESYVNRIRCSTIAWNTLDAAGNENKQKYYNLKGDIDDYY